MKNNWIINQDNLEKLDIRLVGGKAFNLFWLKQNSYNVPDFFVLTSEFCDQFYNQKINESELEKIIEPHWFKNVAVRSSAVDEDHAHHSFAGIHESALNIQSFPEFLEKLKFVIQSAYSERAMKYRQQHQLNTESVKMAVVVQKMVNADKSGVLFTANPLTGHRQEMWISATTGLAQNLVDGQIEASEYQIKSDGSFKQLTHLNELSADDIQQIHNIGKLIAEQKQRPQDIEWCLEQNKVVLVQTRDIAHALPIFQQFKDVYDNSNIQESYNGLTTPLTFSYASKGYELVYTQLMKLMLMSPQEIEQASWRHRNLLGFIYGRVYYQILYWYEGLKYLPHFGRRKKEMEEMMGLEEPIDFIESIELNSWQKIKKLPSMLLLLSVTLFRFARMNQLVKEFDSWFWDLYHSAETDRLALINDKELIQKLFEFQNKTLEKWGTPVLNDFLVMMKTGKVKRTLKKFGLENELNNLMQGAELESLKPTTELHKISVFCSRVEGLTELILQNRGKDLHQKIEIIYPAHFKIICDYIELYGDRTMGELKLETVTMKQDVEMFYTLLRNYLVHQLYNKTDLFSQHDQKNKTLDIIQSKMSGIQFRFFLKNCEKMKTAIAHRELMRFHRTRAFGVSRIYYLEIGRRWSQYQLIENERDIFYLTRDEIFDYFNGRAIQLNLKKLIELRKNEFTEFSNLNLKSQIQTNAPLTQNYTVAIDSESSLNLLEYNGLGCSQGEIEGEIVYLQSPDQIENISGKILLAERTDPGWTPLFALVKGVIIEKGSILSHSAVISREMGIPAVVGVKKITQQLKTGQRVRMNGQTGTIKVLDATN